MGRVSAMLLAVLVAVLAGCSDEGEATAPTPTPTVPPPVATPTAEPTAVHVPATPTPAAGLTGMFLEPRPSTPDITRALPSRPASVFKPWDRESVVLYDLAQGTEVNLGKGLVPSFSPDGTKLAYNVPGAVWVVDLATMGRESFPTRGGLATFVDSTYLVDPGANALIIDSNTGERVAVSEVSDPRLRRLIASRLRPAGHALLGGGLELRRAGDWNAALGSCPDTSEAGRAKCRALAFEQWVVEDISTGRAVLEFRAVAAGPAGPGEVVMATSPQCIRRDGSTDWCEAARLELREEGDFTDNRYAQGTTNIFTIDVKTGQAEFIATATYHPHTRVWPMSWPLVADEGYILWTESYCGQPRGKMRMFDRGTRVLTELEVTAWLTLRGGKVGLGEFGAKAVIDLPGLHYVGVLPQELMDVRWSEDFRYAAVGGVLGHGGLCG